ncbi:MAG: hypothetical protein GTN86_07335 [Xanthomonadales bacterium]|nr:hypothetical protein [Xanthomonadales bacterium]NIN59680.1 hypothetical protein [Xanthomonadales bacterium]NIN75093.1 hypothetical protein [Xanthomonadales bacterium]NIO13427.1 hypothetical protein [Xanthomonadales bacterium]NIP12073.1 hypothetical protein [Xanthomonadales bacterium]
MSESQVDLSVIRGDWYYHMGYVTNAMNRTLDRAQRLWSEVAAEAGDEEVGQQLEAQCAMWAALTSDLDDKGAVRTGDQAFLDFIAACRSTKDSCDALETALGAGGSSSIYDSTLEQFTEACRQARGICDDLEMMREQRPDG